MSDVEQLKAQLEDAQGEIRALRATEAGLQARIAAIEADRAQRVPDVEGEGDLLTIAYLHGFAKGKDFALASTPAQPAQQEPDCPRCNGSGEDPEGYFDQSRGPDGDTHDGPCRDCAGTGAAPQPVERNPMTSAQRERLFIDAERAMAQDINLSWRHAIVEAVERHHGIRE